ARGRLHRAATAGPRGGRPVPARTTKEPPGAQTHQDPTLPWKGTPVTVSSTDAGHDEPWNKIDTTVPHSARVWNYWLRGKDNYAVDRAAGDKFREVFPGIVDIARGTRGFLGRAVTYLAGEAGVRQFLDAATFVGVPEGPVGARSVWTHPTRPAV